MQAARSRLFFAPCTSGRRPLSTILAAGAAGSSRNLTAMSSTLSSARQRVRQQLVQEATADAVLTLHPVRKDADLAAATTAAAAAWARVNSFKAKAGEVLPVPDASGGLSCVVLGLGEATAKAAADAMWAYAALPGKLPAGCYKFSRYKTGKLDANNSNNSSSNAGKQGAQQAASSSEDAKPLLVVPKGADVDSVLAMAEAFYWARDLINTPAEDCGPQHIKAEAQELVDAHQGARLVAEQGEQLLAANWPAVHTVGRAAARPPVVLDITWQPPSSSSSAGADLPLVALVGKGVCFDSGGLDIKTATGMRLMKKDMGGAALVLALAHVIMSARLPVKLRVLVPAVENAISGNAYRPGDVLQTRSGITVENGNTDAEGRLILCDAIWEAANGSAQTPDVLIDAATLTGAARVALGPELPAVFSNSDETWMQLEAAARAESDPMWRLPLWPGYRKMLESKVADIGSTGEPGAAGSITAALFLQEFAKAAPRWLHIDTAGWVSGGSTGPGKPEGGEALGLRALWAFLQARYGSSGDDAAGTAAVE